MKVVLPRFPSSDDIEVFNFDIANRTATNITIDLTAFKRSRLFAESRMLGSLVLAARSNIPIYVKIGAPPEKEKGELALKYSKVFLDSMFGVVIGLLATNIVDVSGRDYTAIVQERLISELRATGGLVWSGAEIAAPIIDRFGYPAPAPLVVPDDQGVFAAKFKQLLFRDLGLLRLNEKLIDNVCEFAFEILQNTRQHGSDDLQGNPLNGIRFLSVRRMNITPDRLLVSQESSSPFFSYLEQLKDCFVIKPQQLVEITIADSGIGIPARMLGSMDVYSSPINEEKEALAVALSPEGTSKPSSVMGAGLGLFKVMQATHQLKGLIVFRTGRSCMYKHYLGDFDDEFSLELSNWPNTSYQLISGTSVSLIFPWTEASQLELI